MVMIPTPAGAQVRSQTDASLTPVRRVAEVPSDLPDFQPGQVFHARIQKVLPENTYKALVAGSSLTLALPESVKAGDTLDLVVVGHTPGAVVAKIVTQLAAPERGALAEPFQRSTLSNLGQLLSSLLPREGETVAPAMLTRGQPLFSSATVTAAALAQRLPAQLAQAVSTSGLFYEAHQVQWMLGQRSLGSLFAEPQGKYAQPEMRAALGVNHATERFAEKSALVMRREAAPNDASALALMKKLFGMESAAGSSLSAERSTTLPSALANSAEVVVTIPDDLRPLVQQQLEAAATQRLVWHGEVWPKQMMEWKIERDAPEGQVYSLDDPATWLTTLRLTLPRLGDIEARVQLSGQNVHLALEMSEAAAPDLRQALPALQQALTVAGLTLQSVQAKQSRGTEK